MMPFVLVAAVYLVFGTKGGRRAALNWLSIAIMAYFVLLVMCWLIENKWI